MTASKQIKNTEIFAFIVIQLFNLLSRKALFINFLCKIQKKLLKSRLLFKKITAKL